MSLNDNVETLYKSFLKCKFNADRLLQHLMDLRAVIQTAKNHKPITDQQPINEQQPPSASQNSTQQLVPIDCANVSIIDSNLYETSNEFHNALEIVDKIAEQSESKLLNNNIISPIIDAIQRESIKVMKLKQENFLLKQQLMEYVFASELIMSKYRSKVLNLLEISSNFHGNILKKHETDERLNKQSKVIEFTNQMEDLIKTFEQKISPHNEQVLLEQMKHLEQLRVEFNGLIEMKQISMKYGSWKNNETMKM